MHIMFLGYRRIYASFPHKTFSLQKDKNVPSYLIVVMRMIVMRDLIWRSTSQVGRRPSLWIWLTSIIIQRTTPQLMNIFYLTKERISSSNYQSLSVSLMRINITSLLHVKSYSNGTLDWEVLGFKICNGQFVQGV